MSDDFDEFIRAQWAAHGDDAAGVGDRLAASTARVVTAAQVGLYAGIVTHVFGVHLAAWSRGADLLRSLRTTPGYDGSPQAEGPIARSLGALALASGDDGAADALPPADRITALASASSALLDRAELDRAIALYDRALVLATTTPLDDGTPAIRSLAAGGNNLAQALEEHADRTPEQTAAMLRAAQAALVHWRRCGGWLEEERAEYRVARSHLRAGQPTEALAAAQRCLAICERAQAPAFERFFGHAQAALAQAARGDKAAANAARTLALATYAQVPEDERSWCADDLGEMNTHVPEPS